VRRALGSLALALGLALAFAGCVSDSGDRATDEPESSPAAPSSTPSTLALIPDLTVATTGEQPCSDARRSDLDAALANGGVWMPNTDLARMDDLVGAWLCTPTLPALQWDGLTVLFLPEAPKGSPRAYFQDAVDRLGRGRIDAALDSPALVLDPDGDSPAEVDLIMGDTHIVLVGTGDTTGDELLAVADSMSPLH
jgi:hypothetical protein